MSGAATYRDIVEPKPTYGRDGDASPRTLGFSKMVSLLVSLNEPNCKETRHRWCGRTGCPVLPRRTCLIATKRARSMRLRVLFCAVIGANEVKSLRSARWEQTTRRKPIDSWRFQIGNVKTAVSVYPVEFMQLCRFFHIIR